MCLWYGGQGNRLCHWNTPMAEQGRLMSLTLDVHIQTKNRLEQSEFGSELRLSEEP